MAPSLVINFTCTTCVTPIVTLISRTVLQRPWAECAPGGRGRAKVCAGLIHRTTACVCLAGGPPVGRLVGRASGRRSRVSSAGAPGRPQDGACRSGGPGAGAGVRLKFQFVRYMSEQV